MFEKEIILNKTFDKYKNSNDLIGECNIIFMIFKINEINPLELKENKNIPLDLYQIFDYLREKKLGLEVPFIKYGDDSFNIPISLISTDAIYGNNENKYSN